MNKNYERFDMLFKSENIFKLNEKRKEKNIFEVTGYPHLENVASNIFCFFFDAGECHKFSDNFIIALKNVLKNKELENINSEIIINTDSTKARREVITENGKYIDIVIYNETEDFAICIENKINAKLYNPLPEYAKKIKEVNNKYIGIVLSVIPITGEKEKKIMKDNNFINLTYSELFDEIDKLLEGKEVDDKWIEFYKEFEDNIKEKGERNIMKDTDFIEWYEENKKKVHELTAKLSELKGELNQEVDKLYDEMMKDFGEKEEYNEITIGKWNHNPKITEITNSKSGATIFSICNIYLKRKGITIDNIAIPNGWIIQLRTNKKERNKILQKLREEYINENKIEFEKAEGDYHIMMYEISESKQKKCKIFKTDEDFSELIEADEKLINILLNT